VRHAAFRQQLTCCEACKHLCDAQRQAPGEIYRVSASAASVTGKDVSAPTCTRSRPLLLLTQHPSPDLAVGFREDSVARSMNKKLPVKKSGNSEAYQPESGTVGLNPWILGVKPLFRSEEHPPPCCARTVAREVPRQGVPETVFSPDRRDATQFAAPSPYFFTLNLSDFRPRRLFEGFSSCLEGAQGGNCLDQCRRRPACGAGNIWTTSTPCMARFSDKRADGACDATCLIHCPDGQHAARSLLRATFSPRASGDRVRGLSVSLSLI